MVSKKNKLKRRKSIKSQKGGMINMNKLREILQRVISSEYVKAKPLQVNNKIQPRFNKAWDKAWDKTWNLMNDNILTHSLRSRSELIDWIKSSEPNNKMYNSIKKVYITEFIKVSNKDLQKVITKQIDALTILFNLMIIKLTVELDKPELFITNSTSMNNYNQNNKG